MTKMPNDKPFNCFGRVYIRPKTLLASAIVPCTVKISKNQLR